MVPPNLSGFKGYSRRLDLAIAFAAREHAGQKRKSSDVPYVAHPFHVAVILMKHGLDEDLVVAGLLHDVVEDCGVAVETLRAEFGERVAGLVAAVSEKKKEAGEERHRPWRVRKEEQLAHLDGAPADVAALKAADALHNASSVLLDAERAGAEVWKRFNASPEEQAWYYGEIARRVEARLGADHPLARELGEAVGRLVALPRASPGAPPSF